MIFRISYIKYKPLFFIIDLEIIQVNLKKEDEGVEMKKETPTEHVMTQLVFVDVPLFDSEKRVLAQMQINMNLSEGFQLQRDWDYDGGTIMVMVKWGIKPTEENIQ